MERSRIKIIPDRFDYIIEILSIIGLIGLIIIPIIYYGKLPEIMPKHFDLHGNPDSYGNKGMVWFLPIIGIVTYIGLSILCKYPHKFNYPTQVTEKNAERIYKKGIIIIRIVKLSVILLFNFLNIKMIEIGLHQADKLSVWFLPIFLIVFISMIIFSIIWLRR